jgi:hypothetical protein
MVFSQIVSKNNKELIQTCLLPFLNLHLTNTLFICTCNYCISISLHIQKSDFKANKKHWHCKIIIGMQQIWIPTGIRTQILCLRCNCSIHLANQLGLKTNNMKIGLTSKAHKHCIMNSKNFWLLFYIYKQRANVFVQLQIIYLPFGNSTLYTSCGIIEVLMQISVVLVSFYLQYFMPLFLIIG